MNRTSSMPSTAGSILIVSPSTILSTVTVSSYTTSSASCAEATMVSASTVVMQSDARRSMGGIKTISPLPLEDPRWTPHTQLVALPVEKYEDCERLCKPLAPTHRTDWPLFTELPRRVVLGNQPDLFMQRLA